jgi:class 3 adenylate cyclase
VKSLGIEIRAGLHTGEVELRSEDVTGMGVNIAARVMDAAGPGTPLCLRFFSGRSGVTAWRDGHHGTPATRRMRRPCHEP